MLTIRLKRQGRKGKAHYRVIVQEHQYSPKSGKVVKFLGSYDPHTKELNIDKEIAETYLNNGAQPSNRVARLFKNEGVKLPKWVKITDKSEKTTKNPEKLRKNQPAESKEEKPAEESSESVATNDEPAKDEPKEEESKTEPETEKAKVEESSEKDTSNDKVDDEKPETTEDSSETDKESKADAPENGVEEKSE